MAKGKRGGPERGAPLFYWREVGGRGKGDSILAEEVQRGG